MRIEPRRCGANKGTNPIYAYDAGEIRRGLNPSVATSPKASGSYSSCVFFLPDSSPQLPLHQQQQEMEAVQTGRSADRLVEMAQKARLSTVKVSSHKMLDSN